MSVTITEATTYFSTRLGVGTTWSASAEQAAALATAERQLSVSYGLSGLTQAELVSAVCEQALFLLQNPGLEKRAALRAQGVVKAGIFQEEFSGPGGIPIAPMASRLLAGLELAESGLCFSGHLHRRHH